MKNNYFSLNFIAITLKALKANLLLIFFMCAFSSVFAQDSFSNSDFRITYVNAQDLEVLDGTGTINTISVKSLKDPGSQPLAKVQLYIQLPPGILYDDDTFQITSQTSSSSKVYVVDDALTTDFNKPIFTIYRATGENDPWGSLDEVVFTFNRTAGCAASIWKEGNNSFKDEVVNFKYTNTGVDKTIIDSNNLIGTYELQSASLSIKAISSVQGVVGVSGGPIVISIHYSHLEHKY